MIMVALEVSLLVFNLEISGLSSQNESLSHN